MRPGGLPPCPWWSRFTHLRVCNVRPLSIATDLCPDGPVRASATPSCRLGLSVSHRQVLDEEELSLAVPRRSCVTSGQAPHLSELPQL